MLRFLQQWRPAYLFKINKNKKRVECPKGGALKIQTTLPQDLRILGRVACAGRVSLAQDQGGCRVACFRGCRLLASTPSGSKGQLRQRGERQLIIQSQGLRRRTHPVLQSLKKTVMSGCFLFFQSRSVKTVVLRPSARLC